MRSTGKKMLSRDIVSEDKDIVVFIVRRDTQCSECKKELGSGSFIYLENRNPLCLSCADLDWLDYLPRGNPALTRRAIKYSKIHTVVVKWSRTRKRYERQGILVEPEAIARAEEECLKDAELREARKQRAQLQREKLDQEYITKFAVEIRKLFPNCPAFEEIKIAQHACRKYSGRIGRTSMAKEFDPQAIALAVRAHIRHTYTKYDELLMKGMERFFAREKVQDEVEKIFVHWQGKDNLQHNKPEK